MSTLPSPTREGRHFDAWGPDLSTVPCGESLWGLVDGLVKGGALQPLILEKEGVGLSSVFIESLEAGADTGRNSCQECQRNKSSFQKISQSKHPKVCQIIQLHGPVRSYHLLAKEKKVFLLNSPFILLIISKKRFLLVLVCLNTSVTLANQLQPQCLCRQQQLGSDDVIFLFILFMLGGAVIVDLW